MSSKHFRILFKVLPRPAGSWNAGNPSIHLNKSLLIESSAILSMNGLANRDNLNVETLVSRGSCGCRRTPIHAISSIKIIILNFQKNKFDEKNFQKNQKLQKIVFNNRVQPLLIIDFTYFT